MDGKKVLYIYLARSGWGWEELFNFEKLVIAFRRNEHLRQFPVAILHLLIPIGTTTLPSRKRIFIFRERKLLRSQ